MAKSIGRNRSHLNLTYYSYICLEQVSITTKTLVSVPLFRVEI